MPQLRGLNETGIVKFREYLASIRAGQEIPLQPAFLYDDLLTRVVPGGAKAEGKKFKRKIDVAAYLRTALAPAGNLIDDAGVWSWLALFYFDQISPVSADGKRTPREDYHYIPSTGSWYQFRHLLRSPYEIYMRHGDHARVLLHPPLNQHGSFISQLAWRREFMTNRGLVEAIDRLYWDEKKKKPRVGITTESRAGSLRRLIAVVQQLDVTYDLHGMSAGQILALLPEEFAV